MKARNSLIDTQESLALQQNWIRSTNPIVRRIKARFGHKIFRTITIRVSVLTVVDYFRRYQKRGSCTLHEEKTFMTRRSLRGINGPQFRESVFQQFMESLGIETCYESACTTTTTVSFVHVLQQCLYIREKKRKVPFKY